MEVRHFSNGVADGVVYRASGNFASFNVGDENAISSGCAGAASVRIRA